MLFYFFIEDETRVLGRTLGHAGCIFHTVLCIPCDFRTHRPVHITCRAESFTLQVRLHLLLFIILI